MNNIPFHRLVLCMAATFAISPSTVSATDLCAGVAKMDITDRAAGPVNDPLFAKALVVKNETATVVLITIDAVAIGEIGRLGNDLLANVRAQLRKEASRCDTACCIWDSCGGPARVARSFRWSYVWLVLPTWVIETRWTTTMGIVSGYDNSH